MRTVVSSGRGEPDETKQEEEEEEHETVKGEATGGSGGHCGTGGALAI